MMVAPQDLSQSEMHAFRTTQAFLTGRLGEAATVSWALNLKSQDRSQLAAVGSLFRSRDINKLKEPWKEAWRLIEESWLEQRDAVDEFSEYEIRERLAAGERTSSVIRAIVSRVAARLKVTPFSDLDHRYRTVPDTPKRITDLFNVGLTSASNLDPSQLSLSAISEKSFLIELATALDLSVLATLAQGRRLGWDPETTLWRFGGLNRVYYVNPDQQRPGENEPDEFNHGIAPSVKLLQATVGRIAHIDEGGARAFMERWAKFHSGIHDRIWASLAQDLVTTGEIFDFMESADQRRFWLINDYPEVAELRARSFANLTDRQQITVCARIKRGPPSYLWRRDVEPSVRRTYQRYTALRELRRIQVAGGKLPKTFAAWFEEAGPDHSELQKMRRIDEGFPGAPKAYSIPPNPDQRFNSISGTERLRALEKSLRNGRVSWDDDPAERASDWIRSEDNVLEVLNDLESTDDPGQFPKVWERFGWTHNVPKADTKARRKRSEATRVGKLVLRLPDDVVLDAIEGLTWWYSNWGSYQSRSLLLSLWRKLWPQAIIATNRRDETADVEVTVETSEPDKAREIDTLNNPVGRMVGEFLDACPPNRGNANPFAAGRPATIIRNQIMRARGRSRLIAVHRLLEGLPYFLRADAAWTEAHLLTPLRANTDDALVLWHAIARRTHFKPVLKVIGDEMLQRATDVRLSRPTRESLVFSLVVECLHSFRERRRPAVAYRHVQQTLRSIEDEVRARAADVLQQFMREISEQEKQSPAELFEQAIAPFLSQVWPQERSLATPGVSRAFADLPAAAGTRFAEAVDAIDRFLVPFDAWSSMEYGLYGADDDSPQLDAIDTERKASALLRLLNATIGTAEGSVVPHDLSKLLAHVRSRSSRSSSTPEFRRLAAAARI